MTDEMKEGEKKMNAVLYETPEIELAKGRVVATWGKGKTKTQIVYATWKKLGHLTDAKIRKLSTLHGAEPIPIDDTVEFKTIESFGSKSTGWFKKGTERVHGVVRVIK